MDMRYASFLSVPFLHALIGAVLLSPAFPAGAAVPGDERWDNQFGSVGVNDSAWSVAVWRGQAYVGGIHTAAGNVRASCVAGFDGTNWFALNNGLNGDPKITY